MITPEIVFALHYANHEVDFGGADGGSEYGHKLLEPLLKLRKLLESRGYKVSTRRQSDISRANIAVFMDMNAELWALARSLPEGQRCILVCQESPIYAPHSHDMNVVLSKRWDGVLTWNRSFDARHICHYDIPIAAADQIQLEMARQSERKYNKGVVVSSRKRGDLRGLLCKRDALYEKLARSQEIDLYGLNWPNNPVIGMHGLTKDKIAALQQYGYSLVIENSLYPGYVTEKLADSILAGIPAIYFGDAKKAEQRFPGTFVSMKELSEGAFFNAKESLMTNYAELKNNVLRAIESSNLWSESFLAAFMRAIEMAHRGKGEL